MTTNPTPTQQETLLPCPLGHPEEKGLHINSSSGMRKWHITCFDCGLYLEGMLDETINSLAQRWNTRAAVAGPRGDVLAELFDLFEKDKRGRWCFKSLSRDDTKFDSIMDRLAAATSSPAPAEIDDTHRCPECGRRMQSDFDEDVGTWYECHECDYREAVSNVAIPAERTRVAGEQQGNRKL